MVCGHTTLAFFLPLEKRGATCMHPILVVRDVACSTPTYTYVAEYAFQDEGPAFQDENIQLIGDTANATLSHTTLAASTHNRLNISGRT